MLARTLEAAGIPTVMVTMMPDLAERAGTPRVLGAEFPFGHTLGHAGDREEQLFVIREALRLLVEAESPPARRDLEREWPDFDAWKKAWHPPEPAPIFRVMRERAQARHQGGESAAG